MNYHHSGMEIYIRVQPAHSASNVIGSHMPLTISHSTDPAVPSNALYMEAELPDDPLAASCLASNPGDACSLIPPAYD